MSGGSKISTSRFVQDWLKDKGHMTLNDFVIVDPDAFKEKMPEWKTYQSGINRVFRLQNFFGLNFF